MDPNMPHRERQSLLRAAWSGWAFAAALGVTAVGAVVLHLMGRRLWCACGSLRPWAWNIWSSHNSQHLLDPYTFTHLLHGALYYALLWWLFGSRWPSVRALVALAAEVTWEVVENTNAVIEAYRESTISLNYYGDSILNSLADIAAFALGYGAALYLPRKVSVIGFVAIEIVLLSTIRDSLLLNVLMLLHPTEAIRSWQMGK